MNYGESVLDILVAFPLFAALVVLLAPARLAKRIALVGALIEFFLSVPLWWMFQSGTAAMQFAVVHPWIPNWGIMYRLGVDGISLFMVLLTTFTIPLAVLGSWNYIKERERPYYALLLVLTTGMLGVFLALDLFVFYVFWEIMLIPMYFIIGVWGGQRRLYAAIKFFLFTFVGSLLMLVAILVLYYTVGNATGTYSFAYDHLLAHIGVADQWAFWLFGAFFLAFAIKVPMFPFHTWLPDAHVEAPTAGSVILAGVLLKMGAYGFLRLAIPLFPDAAARFAPWIGALAVVGIIYGALVALVQPDMKKLVAYSSVSHLGFVMLGIAAFTTTSVVGAVYQMLNHGISTGALFFMVGMLYERRHTRRIEDFGGLKAVMPWFSAAFLMIGLSSIAVPGFNGFVGEFLILIGSWPFSPTLTVLATLGVILAAGYILWMIQRVFYGEVRHKENEGLRDLSLREAVVLVPLIILALVMGLASPLFTRSIEPTVSVLVHDVGAEQGSSAGGTR